MKNITYILLCIILCVITSKAITNYNNQKKPYELTDCVPIKSKKNGDIYQCQIDGVTIQVCYGDCN